MKKKFCLIAAAGMEALITAGCASTPKPETTPTAAEIRRDQNANNVDTQPQCVAVIDWANRDETRVQAGLLFAAQTANELKTYVMTAAAQTLNEGQIDIIEEITTAGKAGLAGAASSSAVRAETALARGITAQRTGTVVEALSYYYEAAKFDPDLAEAAIRSSVLSADIQGGNIGQNVRNDIQRRATWVKVFDEAAVFFKQHLPLEIIYDPGIY
jgi:hypothetical protein